MLTTYILLFGAEFAVAILFGVIGVCSLLPVMFSQFEDFLR